MKFAKILSIYILTVLLGSQIPVSWANVLEEITLEPSGAFEVLEYDDSWNQIWVTYTNKQSLTKLTPEQEYSQAIDFLYARWATSFKTVETFMWEKFVTREQISKLILQSMVKNKLNGERLCDFVDLVPGTYDQSLKENILEICKLWYMRWFENKFMPVDKITRGHFFITILRSLWIEADEQDVYDKSKAKWLTTLKKDSFDRSFHDPITRRDVALVLFRTQLRSVLESYAFADYSYGSYSLAGAEVSSIDVISESSSKSISNGYIQPDTSPLQWWEVDDNKDFAAFNTYYKEVSPDYGTNYTQINLDARYHLQISNPNGPTSWLQVSIEDDLWWLYQLSVDINGEYYFYPSAYYNLDDAYIDSVNSYTITTSYGGTKITKTFAADDMDRDIEFDFVLNYIQAPRQTLQLAFVIDTTWSMWDQINKIKTTIKSVVDRVTSEKSNTDIEYGLVAYRDKNDTYVTKSYQFTSDLDIYQGYLNDLRAWWGWDYPEDINSGLQSAIEYLDWNDSESTIWLAFLVADAPPHMDYKQNYDYRVASLKAIQQGIKIFPLASSGLDNTVWELIFRQIALLTNARYLFITKWTTGKTDYHVDEQAYTVESLDDLIVQVILGEL